jgi:hypothetical protein
MFLEGLTGISVDANIDDLAQELYETCVDSAHRRFRKDEITGEHFYSLINSLEVVNFEEIAEYLKNGRGKTQPSNKPVIDEIIKGLEDLRGAIANLSTRD